MLKRILLTFLSFILFPFTAFIFLAPILIFFLPLFEFNPTLIFIRVILLIWGGVFITSPFLLSTYCGVLCPITKMFNTAATLLKDRSILSHRFPRIIGQVTQVLWLFSFLYVLVRLVGNYYGFLPNAIIYSCSEIIFLYCIYAISALISKTKFGKDELGHYLCPLATLIKVGIKLNSILNLVSFRLVPHPQKCKGCKQCNSTCPYQNDVKLMVQSGIINYSICSNCGKCIAVCRHDAIERKWVSLRKLNRA